MLEKGLSHTSRTTVVVENTARRIGSGDLEVFATPALAALMENAAMSAVAGELPDGSTTVGSELNISHVRPTGIGGEVAATATLTEVDGRRLTFKVEASDGEGLVGEGVHVRFIVDRGRFMSKVRG